MPLVEVEDTELRQLREIAQKYPQSANWEKVWSEILADPKTRPSAQRVFKEKYPNIALPDFDIAEAAKAEVRGELEAMRKEFQEYKESQEKAAEERATRDTERNVNRTIADSHARLRAQGWDDEGIKAIEDEMQKRGVGDYDLVATYLKSQQPKPAPLNAAYEGRDLNWFSPGEDEPDGKLLMDNPKKFLSDMKAKFYQDKANGNMAAWTS